MYAVSSAYKAAAGANARQIIVKAIFNDSITLTGENIIDMSVTEALSTSSGISMGTTISSKLTLQFTMPVEPILLAGGWVRPYVGYYGVNDYCPLGKFYITDITSKGAVYTITAYDCFSKTEVKYVPTIDMPNTAGAILDDIAMQCGFEMVKSDAYIDSDGVLVSASAPSIDSDGVLIYSDGPTITESGTFIPSSNAAYPDGMFDLYDFTCRQYIGYFAGLSGKNARFDRDGRLVFVWYTSTGINISQDSQYMGGFSKTAGGQYTVQSITSGTKDRAYTSGSGVGISFENPFMTQEILDNIYANIGVISFTPANVKWRGNPAVEAGDIVTAEDKDGVSHAIYIMEQTLKISGGLYSEIKCYGDTEAAIKFDTSPASKKLWQVYTKLQEAIADATALLNGQNGGVFEIIDENGDSVNDGWIIHSADGKKFIKANLGGIGITTDGGATYKQAITADGINATAITTGSLNAERIAVENYDENDPTKLTDYIRFGNGAITLGKGNNAITLKLENDQIAFYSASGARLGRFTNNSFEIENLEDGQIRFQNFGFIPRLSGNITFTKLR